ncbi:dsDNA nuclease domain-containing protein [Pseudomonas sp. ACM7]|uniref:dsDNA nuclease domain-containing protein n=1 Tax=Pseudomonas sp. ACM7 TaxID=2052956 RepID=UPI0010114D04|nr:dsDNA nuclease domain-containing protein [Pseudomonas sp. ACM7]QAY94002.1 hypothetical protein CUN63_31210 [Pseudomonas sp. ACM7]
MSLESNTGNTILDFEEEPSISSDVASEVRRAYIYQSVAGVLLLCDAIKNGTYKEFWYERKDDIIGVRKNGEIDVFQVKTKSSAPKWTSRDKDIVKSLSKFGQLEIKFGKNINKYYIYSNVPPYIPSEVASADAKKYKSLIVLKNISNSSEELSQEIYLEELERISNSAKLPLSVLKDVLRKLEFVKGKSLEEFREDIASNLFSLPRLDALPVTKLRSLGSALLQLVEDASTLNVPGLDVLTSVLSREGTPIRLVENKRVTVAEAQSVINIFLSKEKRNRDMKVLGFFGIAAAFVLGVAWYLYKPEAQTYLEKSVRVIYSARNAPLPPSFAESVSAVRSAKFSLDSVNLDAASLRCQDMSKLELSRMSAEWLKGTGVKFIRSNLYMANLSHSELNTSSYIGAIVDNANFDGSNMLFSDFSESISRWSSFKGTSLTASDFSKADFTQADFTDADLSFSELQETNLSNAKLSNTRLSDADLSGANMIGVIGLTQGMLDTACSNTNNPPKLDVVFKPPKVVCYVDEESKEKRVVSKLVTGVVGQMGVLGGYCNGAEFTARPPNGHGNIEFEMPFIIPLKPKE